MLQLILELREKGVVPTVILPYMHKHGKSELVEELQKNNIEYIEMGVRSVKHIVWWKTLPNYFLARWNYKRIFKTLKNRKFDIIHTNCSILTIGSFLSRKFKAKHIWHLREYGDLDYSFKTPFGKWFQRIMYSGDNYFIAISKSIRSHYKPYLSGQTIDLVYNGIKPIDPINRDWNKDRIEICIVGLLHPNKGQLELLKAVDELIKHKDVKGFHINVIGSGDSSYTHELEDFVKNNHLVEYVKFWGYRNDISEILKIQDIGVMASSNEAFGRSTVEYMMAGLGVIATDAGANREIIEDGVSGLLYPSGDHYALADRLSMLLTDRERLKQISCNGRRSALEKFSSDGNSRNIFEIYQKILN